MDDKIRGILYPFLEEMEGYSPTVYEDTTGNKTIGKGVNLEAPGIDRNLASVGLNADKVRSGEEVPTAEQNRKISDQKIFEKEKIFQNMQQNSFPGTQLTPAQQAALLSMTYNNPSLIGPDMRTHLNEADHDAVMREMVLKSNAGKDAGILKRRLREAELYGDPIRFNQMIEQLSPEELKELQGTISGMKNEHELKNVLTRYPFLDQSYRPPIQFNKLYRRMK